MIPAAAIQALSSGANAATIAGVILTAGGVVFAAGIFYFKLTWLCQNAATKADIAALKAQTEIDCERRHQSCRAARQMVETDQESRLQRLETAQ